VAFLLGKAGYYAVGAVLGKEMGDEKLSRESLQGFVEGVEVCKPVDFLGCGGDELLVGRAGYLCGALWLQQKLGQMPVPREVSILFCFSSPTNFKFGCIISLCVTMICVTELKRSLDSDDRKRKAVF